MKVEHYEDIPAQKVDMPGSQDCQIRVLVSDRDGAPTFAMRQFEVAVGGFTPRHFHDYEHEVFVLAGEGTVSHGDTQHPLKTGDVIFVAPNEVHQFQNTGSAPLKFLCLIPNSAAGKPITVAPNEGC
ncbi:MAG: cupin domain-containing protein [Planctomycetota bacterium]|nr:cupin domain-containing protein [Planctomycetota bacterium]